MRKVFELNICDLYHLFNENLVPDNWVFRVKNGRLIYNRIAGVWRPYSDKTIILSFNSQNERFCSPELTMEVFDNT